MEATLVINPGSSSKKYALYEGGLLRCTVTFERTQGSFGRCVQINGQQQRCEAVGEHEFASALTEALKVFDQRDVISSLSDIARAGIRIVAPGTAFATHRLIDERFVGELEARTDSAPLHIPNMLDEIREFRSRLTNVPLYGISDSAFHQTIPAHLAAYSLAGTLEHDVKRFGYHGLSVGAAVRKLPHLLGAVPPRLIVCHIGSGVSVTTLKDGVSIGTSMGYTPASGVMMGTRAGDIDPGALIHMLEVNNLHGADAQRYINTQGGFQGMLGVSDLRTVIDRARKGEQLASDVLEQFLLQIRQCIGAGIAQLSGLDALVLTATAMERNPELRQTLVGPLSHFGIHIDPTGNDMVVQKDAVLSSEESDVMVALVTTDEMGEIDRLVSRCASY